MTLIELKERFQRELGKRELLQQKLSDSKDQLRKAEEEYLDVEQAQLIIQEVAKKTQSELEFHISDMVTAALYNVFDDPYEFKLKFEIDRGKTAAKIKFTRGDIELDPKDSIGGGVFDVAAFALRISTWKLKKPATRPTFFIDEPFKHLNGEDYQERAAELVRKLSDTLGLQFILIVTDKNQLEGVADLIYLFKLKNKISQVKEIKNKKSW